MEKHDHSFHRPLIVGIGGTSKDGSQSETALLIALQEAENLGARTEVYSGVLRRS